MKRRPVHVLAFLGLDLDSGSRADRWDRWRPTVSLFQQDDLIVDRLDLIVPTAKPGRQRPNSVVDDVRSLSPHTEVVTHPWDVDAWDFAAVFSALEDLIATLPLDPDEVDHYAHITTGTHVAKICLYLLAESRQFPGRLLQTSPDTGTAEGRWMSIDLELQRYDKLAARFQARRQAAEGKLRGGIPTHNPAFAKLIAQVERIASASTEPILLHGPTGSGKTRLARRIHDLKRERRLVRGPLVELNCATLRGDQAMSALFGHERGAFTGAATARTGLLRAADKGVLFLDEVGELGLDEQAMLLRAIEDKRFLPVGADKEVSSDFQLVVGTHQDLDAAVAAGRFREDLLARIDLWTFHLPGLADRKEDIAPNLDFELDRVGDALGHVVRFNREARSRYLAWATSPAATWRGSFRDLHASVVRMATLADGGRIDTQVVDEELARLGRTPAAPQHDRVRAALGDRADTLDRFDRVQLDDVLAVCAASRSLSEAGRVLFAQSRGQRASTNDADRLRKYLARFELSFASARSPG